MQRKWHILSPDSERVSTLADRLGCHPAIAAVLVNRGIHSVDHATAFLESSLTRVRSPFLMKDMDRAVERILLAVRRRERILIFGDYDVDGVTATALLFEFLTYVGARVHCYIPNRLTEGYGLSPNYIEKCAVADGSRLIITVDCGISSLDAVRAANRAGIDVIITDHHELPPVMPEAIAVLNPKRLDCPSGFSFLAGVGVVFNLILALRKTLRDEGFWNDRPEPNLKTACDLVALGTVGDMVPLIEENRICVKAGIEVIASEPRPGLKALLDVCQLPNRPCDTRDLAFKLAPRLNAAGRLNSASTALRLLTTADMKTAYVIARELNDRNAERQEIEKRILSNIIRYLQDNPELLKQRALVLDHEGWHQGVIGIVASRLVNKYNRPVVVISVADGVGKGSARSPDGFDLFDGLSNCAGHLEKFGGHKAAAGLSLPAENIPAFRRDFADIVSEKTRPEDLIPDLVMDGAISGTDVCPELADQLEAFAPFGKGNPEPLFMLSDVNVLSARMVGAQHLRMRLGSPNSLKPNRSKPLDAIFFNQGSTTLRPGYLYHLACHVRWNRWQNQKTVQLVIKDWRGAQ